MGKKALVINKTNFDKYTSVFTPFKSTDTLQMVSLDRDEAFFGIPAYLADRPDCETNEELLQILPYVTLTHVDDAGKVNVYAYQRGAKGDENRLHANWSVGYGGHIEEAPEKGGKTFKDVVVENIIRELEEEVQLKLPRWKVELAVRNARIFHDTSNDVGKVHLSFSVNIDVKPGELGKQEEGHIENTKLVTMDELVRQVKHGDINMESWSKIVLGIN